MNCIYYICKIFSSEKINPEPISILCSPQEDIFKNKSSSIREFDFEYIAIPLILSVLTSTTTVNITSFTSSYSYIRIYKIIYKILIPYDPYFNHYENYWLIINKKYKKHCSIKISLYQNIENEIIIDFFSMDKDGTFWKLYHLLKNKCNNIKKSKSSITIKNNICEKKFCEI